MSLTAFGAALVDAAQTYALVERSERLSRELSNAEASAESWEEATHGLEADLASLGWFKLEEDAREMLRTIGLALSKAPPGSKLNVSLLIPTPTDGTRALVTPPPNVVDGACSNVVPLEAPPSLVH